MVPLLPPWTGDGGLTGGLARAARPATGARRMTLPDLSVDLGRGLVLPNPVGLASGTAGYGFELRQLIDLDRLGALFTKGTTLHPREGNPPPRVAEVRGGMLNAIGLHNPGVDHVASTFAPEFSRWSIPVVVNVAGGSVEDYLECLDRLERAEGFAGYELNISCPNIANGLDFGRDPSAAGRLVAAARAPARRPPMGKLRPHVAAHPAGGGAAGGCGPGGSGWGHPSPRAPPWSSSGGARTGPGGAPRPS